MSVSIATIQQELVNEFNFFDNWLDRYEYIIDLGKQLPEFPSQLQREEYRVSGCQAQVWIYPEWDGEKIHFTATSDAIIVKGLIAILLRLYSGKTPEGILSTKPEFIALIGLDKYLSPTRSNGLYHMLKVIFEYAQQYKKEYKK